MSDRIACFFLEPTLSARRSLRIFTYSSDQLPACAHPYGHDARVPIDDVAIGMRPDGVYDFQGTDRLDHFLGDPRWPRVCASCGFLFGQIGERQVFMEPLYRRTDTGEILTLHAAPAGAIWNADWLSDHAEWRGPDGRTLVCRCPDGHDWTIDGRASNCDSPCLTCRRPYHGHYKPGAPPCVYVDAKPHKCWVRHGEPPALTVDKDGVTCGAGAGSIQTPHWHGFLRGGFLVGA